MVPNFLIVGAARAGTSALYHYLIQHPQIFLPRMKELRYFALDGVAPDFRGPGDESVNRNWVTTWEDYCAHFSHVRDEWAIGEVSPFYLCSDCAAHLIKQRLPTARVIMVLREPAKRAFSSFQYLRMLGREPISDFRTALAAEEQRIRDNWEFLWHYRRLGFYGGQVQRYLELFPRNHIWIGIYDDFLSDPLTFLKSIFRFLKTDDTVVPNMVSRPNVSGIPKSETLHKAITTHNPMTSVARLVVPRRYRPYVRSFLTHRNLECHVIPLDVEQDLRASYRPDIQYLEGLIERDLSAWIGQR